MDCIDRVMRRRDIRRIVDIKIAFDAETQLLGNLPKELKLE